MALRCRLHCHVRQRATHWGQGEPIREDVELDLPDNIVLCIGFWVPQLAIWKQCPPNISLHEFQMPPRPMYLMTKSHNFYFIYTSYVNLG